ncbi:MAG: hypothetical protein E7G28_13130 [Cutibacterium avidum]|nr:hypothetical protein [Cutibacterium avidum]MDU3750060.1 hypothetical protein [Cutibacterium avidum]
MNDPIVWPIAVIIAGAGLRLIARFSHGEAREHYVALSIGLLIPVQNAEQR